MHSNKEVRHLAFRSMERFLEVVASQIVAGRRSPDADKKTFSFFMKARVVARRA